jgi:hypothetical protein
MKIKVNENYRKIHIAFADNHYMRIEGLTITEMAETLELPYTTVQKRLERYGIQPITTGAIYPKEALEIIRNVPPRGRPPRDKTKTSPS